MHHVSDTNKPVTIAGCMDLPVACPMKLPQICSLKLPIALIAVGSQERAAGGELIPEAEPGPSGRFSLQHSLLHLQCSHCR